MLEFTFKIFPDGVEPYEVTARSRDISHWERTNKGASLDRLSNNPTVTDLESLAYTTASRRGKFGANLNEFRETCDFDVVDPNEADGDGDGSGPTSAAR